MLDSEKIKDEPTVSTLPPEPVASAPAASPAANEPVPPTPSSPPVPDIAKLQERAAKADENWDKYLRALADLENYKKRALREREEFTRAASERIVAALLPVLDNFERALAAGTQSGADATALLEGVRQIHSQFLQTLKQFGLEEVPALVGHPFDPNLHEAISHAVSHEHPEGTIANQVQSGYRLANRLLRPARVVVSMGKRTT